MAGGRASSFLSYQYISFALISIIFAGALPAPGFAAIRFEDISQKAGISVRGPTAASSWGDFNNDGWADLWVSNHHGIPPNLYLNQQDGTFIDAASRVLGNLPDADFHGAAWSDFDNDGDQDLIVTTGGGAGRGISPNSLYVNVRGKLVDQAKILGLDYPLGRGRTPLWIDANNDGKLDLLLMNHSRAEAPSAIFLQTDTGFVRRNQALGFPQPEQSFTDEVLSDISEFFESWFSEKPGAVTVSEEFAQLADVSGNNRLDLIAYMQPMRIYSTNSRQLLEISRDMEFPDLRSVQDAAVEDFNGDGQPEWYFARFRPWVLDVVQAGAMRLQGKMASRSGQPMSVSFRTEGEVTFEIHRPWMDPSDPARNEKPDFFIGSRQSVFTDPVLISVSPDTPAVREPAPSTDEDSESLSIWFDPVSKSWALKSSIRQVGFIITSTKPIEAFQTQGFKPSKGGVSDALLVRSGNTYTVNQTALVDDTTVCGSVVAGDFDNDMDIDLYLVCAEPTENIPNILYENDGRGHFSKVPQAGGAEGSRQGRGNQAVTADIDRDGFLDIFVTNGAGPPPFAGNGPQQLFRNLGNDNHWLEIDLQGVASNRSGIGAKIVLEAQGKVQVRQQGGGMHSFSQNHARIHFGLGPNLKADKLTIHWPSGIVQQLDDIQVDQILLVKEQKTDH